MILCVHKLSQARLMSNCSSRPILSIPLHCTSVSNCVLVENCSSENDLDLYENEQTGEVQFHVNGFVQRYMTQHLVRGIRN